MKLINYKFTDKLLCLSFMIIVIFSAAISSYFGASSMRFGLFVTLGFFVFIAIVVGLSFKINYNITLVNLMVVLIIFIIFVASVLISPEKNFYRYLGSVAGLLFLSMASLLLCRAIIKIQLELFNRVLFLCLYLLITIGFSALFFQKTGYFDNKSMIIFDEPSHYGVAVLPFIFNAMLANVSVNKKILIMVLCFTLAILLHSLTLLVGLSIALIIIFTLISRRMVLLLLSVIFCIFYFNANILYYSDRLDFSGGSLNLSVLVFLSGWEVAYSSLVETYGVGLGFQQLGVNNEVGKYQFIIMSLLGGEKLNYNDGGSLAPKLIAELGVLGLFLVVIYVLIFAGLFKKLILNKYNEYSCFYFPSVFLAFSIEMFVRGFGYFSVGSLMFLSSLYWFKLNNNKFKNNYKLQQPLPLDDCNEFSKRKTKLNV
jgi:hypothetical protein